MKNCFNNLEDKSQYIVMYQDVQNTVKRGNEQHFQEINDLNEHSQETSTPLASFYMNEGILLHALSHENNGKHVACSTQLTFINSWQQIIIL